MLYLIAPGQRLARRAHARSMKLVPVMPRVDGQHAAIGAHVEHRRVVVIPIELLIDRHPAVSSTQAVGIPDHRMGEIVGAFIILKQGSECTENDVIEFCNDKVGKYKIPKYIKFVQEFPVTAVGKVQKFKLRESAEKELGLSNE